MGAPQLLLPQGADQFGNAEAVSAAGAALSLLPADQTADAIADQTRKLLSDKGYREAAGVIAEEIRHMPSPEDVARRLPEYA